MKFMAMLLCAAMVCGLASCSRDENCTSCNETSGEWIDLGLPSGTLWYSVNLGASSPEEYGCYVAWGETAAKESYSNSNYPYYEFDGSGNLVNITKYNFREQLGAIYGTVDNKKKLEASDDVATAVLGGGAHMPTRDECIELVENTTKEWVTQNGVNGMRFTASNGRSIFLPAAGEIWNFGPSDEGQEGRYWTSELGSHSPKSPLHFIIWAQSNNTQYNNDWTTDGTGITRQLGLTVRAVKSAAKK